MAWCHKATSHCPSQCWPRSIASLGHVLAHSKSQRRNLREPNLQLGGSDLTRTRAHQDSSISIGPFVGYVKLRPVAHAPAMPRTFSPPPRVIDPDMLHDTCVTHVSWCMPGSITSDSLWSRWREKRSRHSRCMRNPQFYLIGKRPMATVDGWHNLFNHMAIHRQTPGYLQVQWGLNSGFVYIRDRHLKGLNYY